MEHYREQINAAGGKGLLVKHGTLRNALTIAYPEQHWDNQEFLKRGKRSQQRYPVR
jgi:hypothetical protein